MRKEKEARKGFEINILTEFKEQIIDLVLFWHHHGGVG